MSYPKRESIDKMKNGNLNTFFLMVLLLTSTPCYSEGFKIDMPLVEIIKSSKKLTLQDLAVGERGLLSPYGLGGGLCADADVLKVPTIARLKSKP